MKRVLATISCISVFLCLVTSAQAAGEDLLRGEVTLQAYTLNNGEPVTQQSDDGSSNITLHHLFIFSDAMNTVLNRDLDRQSRSLTAINEINLQGMSIKADYSPTSNVTFYSSLGLTNTSTNERLDYTDRIGWEVDLGVAYKFLNNFAYEVHFGYMDTGELFTESNRYTDVEDITIVTNKLTMSF